MSSSRVCLCRSADWSMRAVRYWSH